MKWLAYLHPAGMLAVLGVGLWALGAGLRVRRARLRGSQVDAQPHRRLGKLFVLLALAGYAAGLASMTLLRGEPPLESLHALLTSLAVTALACAGGLGLSLERGAGPVVRGLHLAWGAVGLLAALGAAVAGMAILP
jgi:hypothetical protein